MDGSYVVKGGKINKVTESGVTVTAGRSTFSHMNISCHVYAMETLKAAPGINLDCRGCVEFAGSCSVSRCGW